jgi:hypothetical protein
VKEMNISQYIKSKPELDAMNYYIVYQTIITLLADGLLSMNDFKDINPCSADGLYKNNK